MNIGRTNRVGTATFRERCSKGIEKNEEIKVVLVC